MTKIFMKLSPSKIELKLFVKRELAVCVEIGLKKERQWTLLTFGDFMEKEK